MIEQFFLWLLGPNLSVLAIILFMIAALGGLGILFVKTVFWLSDND